jgi:hypothetical protein
MEADIFLSPLIGGCCCMDEGKEEEIGLGLSLASSSLLRFSSSSFLLLLIQLK